MISAPIRTGLRPRVSSRRGDVKHTQATRARRPVAEDHCPEVGAESAGGERTERRAARSTRAKGAGYPRKGRRERC